jgi:hypothetical protein
MGIHNHKHICVGLVQCLIVFLGRLSRLSQANRRKRWVVPCCLPVNKG